MNNDWFEQEQLIFAAQDGDLKQVQNLILEGFPLDLLDESGKSALHYAVENENFEIAKALLAAGADINVHDETTTTNTPLAEFAATCSLAMAKFLLTAGADPSIRGWMQLSAIDRARDRKRGDGPAVFKLLTRSAKTW